MKNPEWLQKVSEFTRLQYYPQHKVFGDKAGSVIGVRDGFIVAIGVGKTDDKKKAAIRLLIRLAPMQDPNSVGEALASARGKFDKPVMGASSAALVRTYSFGKPSPETVATDVDNLLAALRTSAQPIQGVCEGCQRTETAITLWNDVPGHHCTSCQEKMRSELDAAAVQYAAQDSNLFLGVLYGVAAALLGSIAWGGVAYLIHYIFLYGAIFIGLFVGKAVVLGMGKVTWPGRIVMGILTLASVAFGDIFFFALMIMKEVNTGFGIALRLATINFWKIETDASSGVLSMVFALVGAGVVMHSTRQPEFKARFEPLGEPASGGTKAAGAF